MEFAWFFLVAAVCGLMVYGATRIEPHWVSKDGRRFLCSAQPIGTNGEVEGRLREVRIIVLDDGAVQLSVKRHMRRRTSMWKVIAKSPEPPRRREVFLLTSTSFDDETDMVALRLPSKSKAVPVLETVLAQRR